MTNPEKKAGWQLLFDGKTMTGWRSIHSNSLPQSWYVENGCLVIEKNKGEKSSARGDLMTIKAYKDFDLVFDFMMTTGANSGVKYLVDESLSEPGSSSGYGFEYQIIDDRDHPIFKTGKYPAGGKTAGLYELIDAPGTKKLNPVGQWNTGRIVSKDGQMEHWLNGEPVVGYTLGSEALQSLIMKSKFKNKKGYGRASKGHILLQDHGDQVSFRNIKIREL